MKKKLLSMLTTLVMVVSLCGVLPAVTASAKVSGDYNYEILDDGTVEITKYNGSATTLSIPSTINGKKVTSIAGFCFFQSENLKKVTIPKSIKNIKDAAFLGCQKLKKIKILNKSTYKKVTNINCRALDNTLWFNNIVKKKLKKIRVNGVTAVSKAKEKLYITWKKVKKSDGYMVQVSLRKNFKDGLINTSYVEKLAEGYNKNNCELELKGFSGQECYVRVRTGKLISIGSIGKYVYGKWSKIKKVTIE